MTSLQAKSLALESVVYRIEDAAQLIRENIDRYFVGTAMRAGAEEDLEVFLDSVLRSHRYRAFCAVVNRSPQSFPLHDMFVVKLLWRDAFKHRQKFRESFIGLQVAELTV